MGIEQTLLAALSLPYCEASVAFLEVLGPNELIATHHGTSYKKPRLIRDRGVSYAQASEDLKVHPTQLRNWVKAFADDPQQHFLVTVR